MNGFLKIIIAAKKREVERNKILFPAAYLKRKLGRLKRSRNFKKAISGERITLIAEIKKASPSKGVLLENFHPEKLAVMYRKAGVNAVSVLTENKYFKGKLEYINAVRKAINVPVLRKDFIIDEYQLYETKYHGADAVLLICRILTPEKLKQFLKTVKKLKMQALVEVHTKKEIKTAVKAGADIIGINNRNLKNFKTTLKTTAELIKYIPEGKIAVSESGINSRRDVLFLEKLGIRAVLIGEALMRSRDIPAKINELLRA